MSVLIVEDEPAARETIVDSLSFEGYETQSAADGVAAIRRLEQGHRPCVILLDLMMPGMNGWQLREWLRKDARFDGIPIVVLSAIPDLKEEARRLGVTGFLEKPVRFESLLGVVQRYCPHARAS